jgi:hypothetical protein
VAADHLLTSVVWDITPVYSAMIQDLKDDTFGTKRYAITLADDSVQLLKTDLVPDDVWEEIQESASRSWPATSRSSRSSRQRSRARSHDRRHRRRVALGDTSRRGLIVPSAASLREWLDHGTHK